MTCRHFAFRSCFRSVPDLFRKNIQQILQTVSLFRRNAHRRNIPRQFRQILRRARQIRFVPDGDQRSLGREVFPQMPCRFFGVFRRRSIQNPEDAFGIFQRIPAAENAEAFHRIGGLVAQSRRIGEPDRYAAQGNEFFKGVARGSRYVRDNGAVEAEKGIEQTGFARIGQSRDDCADTVPEDCSVFRRINHAFQDSGDPAQFSTALFRRHPVEAFFGEIQSGFKIRQQMQQALPEFPYDLADASGHLPFRQPCRAFGFGGNEVRDRFRLGEIHFPVEKSTPGEFTRSGGTRARLKNRFQKTPRRKSSAVTMQFHGIFPGETAGTGHVNRQTWFAGCGVVRLAADFSQEHFSGILPAERMTPAPDRIAGFQGVRSGNPYDRQCPARCGAECGNRVIIIDFLHLFLIPTVE